MVWIALKQGLSGIRREALAARGQLRCSDYNDLKKLYFYDAILILADASIAFAHRYADFLAKGFQEAPVLRPH